jgi:hypothetical protein
MQSCLAELRLAAVHSFNECMAFLTHCDVSIHVSTSQQFRAHLLRAVSATEPMTMHVRLNGTYHCVSLPHNCTVRLLL